MRCNRGMIQWQNTSPLFFWRGCPLEERRPRVPQECACVDADVCTLHRYAPLHAIRTATDIAISSTQVPVMCLMLLISRACSAYSLTSFHTSSKRREDLDIAFILHSVKNLKKSYTYKRPCEKQKENNSILLYHWRVIFTLHPGGNGREFRNKSLLPGLSSELHPLGSCNGSLLE